MVLVSEVKEWTRTVFAGAPWGPARCVRSSIGVTTVTVGEGRPVTLTWSGMKTDGIAPHAFLEQGTPVLLDGERVATAKARGRDLRLFCKPGRIRFEGDPSELVTPGLRLKGHFLPQRMTLADDEGKLVWSRALSGALNLRSGPLLVVPPKVSSRATPEHIALWLAAWTQFETGY